MHIAGGDYEVVLDGERRGDWQSLGPLTVLVVSCVSCAGDGWQTVLSVWLEKAVRASLL